MNLAILNANTDRSDFSARFPRDGEKFQRLINSVRPNWTFDVYDVTNREFPDDISKPDGFIITGSPASVHDGEQWVKELFGLIAELFEARRPVFGACFGHQAIAQSLGGEVAKNPTGWVLGSVETNIVQQLDWTSSSPRTLTLYAAHNEQVVKLPDGAKIVRSAADCDAAGFVIGQQIYSTQYHPEMTDDFVLALTVELSDVVGPQVTASAQSSLVNRANNQEFVETIARFFEQNSFVREL